MWLCLETGSVSPSPIGWEGARVRVAPLDQRLHQFVRVLGLVPVQVGGKLFHFKLREHPLQLRDERRRVKRLAVGALARKSDRQFFIRARAGDGAEVTLARNLIEQVRAERDVLLLQFVTVGVGQNQWRGGRGGKNGFVHAEDERKFQIWISRPVNRANQNLVQRRRNHTDGEVGEAGLQNRQPVAQRQRLARKGEREIIQPGIHLLQDRRVACRLPVAGCRFFFAERPAFQSLFYFQIAPKRSEEHTSELQSRQYLVCRL